MIDYVAVLPYVHEPYFIACMETLKIPEENLLIIDARLPNDPGLAGSLNKGISLMRERQADWLVVLNPAMRFGEEGGLDIERWLEVSNDNIIWFAEKHTIVKDFHFGDTDKPNFAWHCCAINSMVFDAIGKLDPNFYPVYFEDIDFDLRYRKHFGNRYMSVKPIDAKNESIGHSVRLAGVKVNTEKLITYFATKWGKHPMAESIESYDYPFNDKNNSLTFWPPAQGQLWDE